MNQRLIYLDILKGIGILWVIIGHIFILPNNIRIYLYSFHMPLFFSYQVIYLIKKNINLSKCFL